VATKSTNDSCTQSSTLVASAISTLPLTSTQGDNAVTTWSHPSHHGPLGKRIPRSARPVCAQLLSDLIKSIIQHPTNVIDKWSDLLHFGSFILLKPSRGGNKRNLTKVIQQRVVAWKSGERDHSQQWTPRSHRAMTESELSRHRAKAVTSKLEEGNFKAAIRLVCSDDRPAINSAETLHSSVFHSRQKASMQSRECTV